MFSVSRKASKHVRLAWIVLTWTDTNAYIFSNQSWQIKVLQHYLHFTSSILYSCLYKEIITLTKFSARYGEVLWKEGPLLDPLGIGCRFGIHAVYALLDGFVNGWLFFANDLWDFAGSYTMLPTKLHRQWCQFICGVSVVINVTLKIRFSDLKRKYNNIHFENGALANTLL